MVRLSARADDALALSIVDVAIGSPEVFGRADMVGPDCSASITRTDISDVDAE